MVKDLTVGKSSKVLWAFCLPLLVSAVFQPRRGGRFLSHYDDIHGDSFGL